MEESGRFIQRKNRAHAGESPTRLQKHAPASLELDEVLANPFASSADASSLKAIPLLSPLVLSPQPLPETTQTRISHSRNNDTNSSSSIPPTASASAWQHPAMAPMPDPSSLFTFFRKQCVILNQAQ